jgi:N-acyl-phosphatidylethanolamine-hydrolysing phospholipase D
MGRWNVLTDPVWSRRASPVPWAGPARLVRPGLPLDRLPPVDAVVLSHDHYDHLDAPTVARLRKRFGDALHWFTPLGYHEWLAGRGVERVAELDWWDEAFLGQDGGTRGGTQSGTQSGRLRFRAVPAQHWTRRGPFGALARLWAAWVLEEESGLRVFFAGDTGYFPGFREIGRRYGPFDAVLLPIGAYEPRWFMRPMHMNPEEAVRAYGELGGSGLFVAMHWGTFRLTDEPVLEPPMRVRAAWEAEGLPPEELKVLRHGETVEIRRRV